MNKIRNHSKELIILTILLAVAVSVVNAAVFVYYPISITAEWKKPPVRFDTGSNAGKADLSDTITVTPGDDGASVAIIVHPSRRQTTYYKNITLIINDDNKNYYYGFNVTQAFNPSGPIEEAVLIVRQLTGGDPIVTVDLKSTGPQGWGQTLSAGGAVRIDLRFKINTDTESAQTALVQLVYSPTYESLP